jgi:mono/diheme cytochrome c family protein
MLAAVIAAPLAIGAQEGGVADGKTTFETVCSTCHTVDPPHKLAPPMSHVARRYRMAFKSEEEAVAAMVAFVLKPDATKATMPPMAIERFGLMPPLPLSEGQLRAVAKYIWSLGEPAK